jgi:hypothetical protein
VDKTWRALRLTRHIIIIIIIIIIIEEQPRKEGESDRSILLASRASR